MEDMKKDNHREDNDIIRVLAGMVDDSSGVDMDDIHMHEENDYADSEDIDSGIPCDAPDKAVQRVFSGSPAAKLALHALAGIAVDIAIGYPNGVDAGLVDFDLLDRRAISIFKSAEPYLTASRGEDFNGYVGQFRSRFKDVYIESTLAKLKAFNAASEAVESRVKNGTEVHESLIAKRESCRLTPKELSDAKIMREESKKEATVMQLQCKDKYFQDIMDFMHIILTSSKNTDNNDGRCFEADAADAFIMKLRSNPVMLARSLALDASSYVEKDKDSDISRKVKPKGMGH